MYLGIPRSESKKLKKFSSELNKTGIGVATVSEEAATVKFYDPPFDEEESNKQPTILDFIKQT